AAKRIQNAIERMITATGYKDAGVETNENMQILSEGQGKISKNTKIQNTLEYSLIKSVYNEFVGYDNNPKTAFWLFADTTTTVLDAQGNDIITYDNLPDGAFG
ncbi:hypothetical protein, partial [Streptomyces atratus]|uniref:hypothetical protein n=1 Tax=Streptomyces atratus TaxID=1893 RepID=UPI0036657D8B